MGGRDEISAANMEKILSSVGVEADKERLAQVVTACKGKSTEELIAAGLPKLASMVVVELLLRLPPLPVVLLLRRLLRRRPRRRRRRRSPRRRTMTWASDSSTSRSLWPFLMLTTCFWQICWKLEIKIETK